jgi:hypothetical protein
MQRIEDRARSYEDLRNSLGDMSLRNLRLSMAKTRGLVSEDLILSKLNGYANTSLRKHLEERLYRETYKPR